MHGHAWVRARRAVAKMLPRLDTGKTGMPQARINGASIHYEITGRGRPLVLTAGQGVGSDARQALVRGLARHRAVLTYDQRGTGRSGAARQDCPMEELAGDIAGLMDAAGFDTADVIGLSTGTGKATALAALHPARVSRLVLAAPWTHGDDYLTTLQRLRIAAAQGLPPDQYFHFNTLLIYPPEHRQARGPSFHAMAVAAQARPQDAQGIAGRLEAILAFDARPYYPRIQCPALVVGARDDLVMPCWFAQAAAQAIPGARLVLLPRGGHLFAETRPAAFLRHAIPFLSGRV